MASRGGIPNTSATHPTDQCDRGSSYYYRFWKGGRLHERGGYPTRKAAQDAEWERRQEVRALRPRDAARPPKRLHEAVQEYLTKVVTRHRNAVGERYTFRLLLERFAEDRRLDALTSPDLEEYVAWRLGRPGGLGRRISRTTVNRDLAHISAFFSWCQDRSYVRDGFNPARARRRRRTDVVSREGAVSVRGVERFEQRFRPYIVLTPQQRRQLLAELLCARVPGLERNRPPPRAHPPRRVRSTPMTIVTPPSTAVASTRSPNISAAAATAKNASRFA